MTRCVCVRFDLVLWCVPYNEKSSIVFDTMPDQDVPVLTRVQRERYDMQLNRATQRVMQLIEDAEGDEEEGDLKSSQVADFWVFFLQRLRSSIADRWIPTRHLELINTRGYDQLAVELQRPDDAKAMRDYYVHLTETPAQAPVYMTPPPTDEVLRARHSLLQADVTALSQQLEADRRSYDSEEARTRYTREAVQILTEMKYMSQTHDAEEMAPVIRFLDGAVDYLRSAWDRERVILVLQQRFVDLARSAGGDNNDELLELLQTFFDRHPWERTQQRLDDATQRLQNFNTEHPQIAAASRQLLEPGDLESALDELERAAAVPIQLGLGDSVVDQVFARYGR